MRQSAEENKDKMNKGGRPGVLDWDRVPVPVREGIEALKDKKVENLRIYDLRGFTPFCDFVIIGTVHSSAQSKSASAALSEVLKNHDFRHHGTEGDENSNWLLIDFWDVVLHLFRPETREYYNLEALWADFPWWPGEIMD